MTVTNVNRLAREIEEAAAEENDRLKKAKATETRLLAREKRFRLV